ncbi:NmrA-like family protein [Trichoderma velutinum]
MGTTIKNVVILGASGSVGSVTISALKELDFQVSVVVRSLSTASFPEFVTVHKSDYSTDSLVSIFKGQDAVVSVIAASDVTIQKNAIDAAVAAGVKRFLPSEYGGDTSLPEIEKFTPFAKGKKEVFSYLRSKEADGLTWTALYTGPFFDSLLEIGTGLMGWEVEDNKATIYDSGNQRYDATNFDTVGKAIASVLMHIDITRNQQVYVNSFKVCQNEVIEGVERLLGKKIAISRASSVEIAERGRQAMAQGEWQKGYFDSATGSTHGPWGFCDFGGRSTRWNDVLDIPKEDLDATLKRVLKNKKLL